MNFPTTQIKKIEPDNDAIQWPEQHQFKKSIRFEFALYISSIIILLMSITGYFITSFYVESATRNVLDKLLTQSRSYSSSAGKLIISSKDPDELLLNNICKKLAAENPDVYWAGITNQKGIFIAHTDIVKVITSEKMPDVTSGSFPELLKPGESLEISKDSVFTAVPVIENNLSLGKLVVASSDKQITIARKTSILTVVLLTVIIIILCISSTLIILGRKLRSISIITNYLKQIDFEKFSFDFSVKDKNEFGYLAKTLKVMAARLNIAQNNLIENERMARELEIAREIQANILPREFPKSELFEFAGKYYSAKEVGGDYYDFIEIDDNFLAFVVADVSGKSLPGMLIMLLTRDIIKEFTRSIIQPAELLKHVNQELRPNLKRGTFVTMFYGLLNKNTGQLDFASAGHNPLIKIDGGSGNAELIQTTGYPLGLMPAEQFNKRIKTGHLSLAKNDLIIQYTDGINEALNSNNKEFGMDLFMQLIKSFKHLKADEIVDEVLQQHQAFVGSAPQYDDITLIALKWCEKITDIKYIQLMENTNETR
ncbi:MAG: PP2C family protein-serine/threonine phosphatase [candidate division Zixibacteria bacterium]|nr:PP2C family protein-serine/threonine phosphatase [candidate division Zixibacteria bacterium]